jgi:hypothetical protein
MKTTGPHRRAIVIIDEDAAVGKLFSVHPTILAGRMFLDVILCEEKTRSEKKEKGNQNGGDRYLFHFLPPREDG